MQIIMQELETFWFWSVLASAWLPPTLLAMRFATPKLLTKRYFRQPHFSRFELIFFNGYPGSLVRTIVFIAACSIPGWKRGRRLDDIIEHAPRWYIVASRIFMALFFINPLPIMLLTPVILFNLYVLEGHL